MEKKGTFENAGDVSSLLQGVIETAIDGIITIDANGIVETFNPAASNLFGYSKQEVIGQNVKMLMPSPDRDQHDQYLTRYHRTQEPHIIGIGREVTGRRKDGSTFPMRLAVSEVRLEERLVFTGVVHDLTRIKEAQAKFQKLNEQLEEKVAQRTNELANVVNRLLETNKRLQHEVSERKAAVKALREQEMEIRQALEKEKELSELKSRFVSMASHEFRTPLSTVLSSVNLIARYQETDQQGKREKHINRIRSSVRNMTSILNDFLSLSKLEEGVIESRLTDFSASELCKEVIDEMTGLVKPGQKIIFNAPDLPIPVRMDERFLKNILFNLLSNAIKYSNENKRILCSLDSEAGQLVICIKDEGMGIPENDQQHLFSRFFRAANAVNIQGTGLGLNIVKRYVDLLGGSITFVSKLDLGTTFEVRLPLNPDQ